MQKIVVSLLARLVSLGSVEQGDEDIYEYGLLILLTTGFNLFVTIIIGILFGAPLETFIFFIAFSALRTMAGGYHAKSIAGCVVVSVGGIAASVAAIRFLPALSIIPAAAVLSVISAIIVYKYAPVEHNNRELSTDDFYRFQRNSRIVVSLAIFVAAVLCIFANPRFGLSISLGIMLSSSAVLTAVIHARKGDDLE